MLNTVNKQRTTNDKFIIKHMQCLCYADSAIKEKKYNMVFYSVNKIAIRGF